MYPARGRTPEPVLAPNLPIVDTHHHPWERPGHGAAIFQAGARSVDAMIDALSTPLAKIRAEAG